MKRTRLTNLQRLSLIMSLALVLVAFLIGSKSYFNTKELHSLSENCHTMNGLPTVEMSFMNLEYSFSCEK
ncbi:hypothetical protein [Bacillus sp. REN10]|uniref:hypothetical protein n=1 Tax=Bacillus sp. REN10 TaxID=2782541 RepID=UPI00193C2880|nr:hypothetical protein [Bacillus sp. REN10]